MDIRFTRDGTIPSSDDELYIKESYISESDNVILRLFDKKGRGGRHIVALRHHNN